MKIRKDYQDHFISGVFVGMLGVVIGWGLSTPILSALIFGVIVGCVKEFVYDKWMGKGYFEWKDIFFTTAGAVIMGLIVKLMMIYL